MRIQQHELCTKSLADILHTSSPYAGAEWGLLEGKSHIYCIPHWVPEVRHTSGETVPEKRSPGTASPRLGNAVHMK